MTTATKTLEDLALSEYKYGFFTNIEANNFPSGLNEESIKLLSKVKNESKKMLGFRLKAYKKWKSMNLPDWCPVYLSFIDFQKIVFYSAPIYKKLLNNLDEVDPVIRETFDKLGLSLTEQKRIANVATDIVFDSESIATTFSEELHQAGVILCSISEGIKKYWHLIEKNLGRAVPIGDNFYAALNAAVFTDGSFVYIPKKVKCPLELGTYFRINNQQSGQFERTLIVAEEGSYVSYLEGCTAPQYATYQFHAAVVELVALKNAEIKYSTIQNWYAGDKNGNGGLLNFVTKRGICAEENSRISWTQIETGSAVTWKYPSCVLVGDRTIGEFFSVALTNHYQQADSGSKMFHLGKNTKSRIISKGVSFGRSVNTYRGLVKIGRRAFNSRNFSQCDSVIFGHSQSNTFPCIEVQNSSARLEHEATASKIAEEQLFYLLQRGLNMEEAISLILSGFCSQVFEQLPVEFASEADFLLSTKLVGSVG